MTDRVKDRFIRGAVLALAAGFAAWMVYHWTREDEIPPSPPLIAEEPRPRPLIARYREGARLSSSEIEWREISKGLQFARVLVFQDGEEVDSVAVVRIDPRFNRMRVFSGYKGPGEVELLTIEEWQERTGALVVFNSAQYRAEPYGAPLCLLICDGKEMGSDHPNAKGMLVGEPRDPQLPLLDLLDFRYDPKDWKDYTQGVQHYPILLDRDGRIRVKPTDWQANRTVVAKDRAGRLLVFVTEGGYFTLYNFGRFLRESEFDVETAMNLDGGYEAELCIRTPEFSYISYGQFETQGPDRDISIPGVKFPIPSVIGIFPR